MPRTRDPVIQERNLKLVEDFREHPEFSYEEIGARNNVRSPQLVYTILRLAGVLSKANRKPRRKYDTMKAISPLHRLIGAAVSYKMGDAMADKIEVNANLSKTEAARVMHIGSAQRLTLICQGLVELTLSDLGNIASFLDYESVAEMLIKLEERQKYLVFGKKSATTGSSVNSTAATAVTTGK